MTRSTTRPIIGLLLEGTYPFVRGGVSGWVHQLIQGLADYVDFRLTYIGSHPQENAECQYELPNNVLSLDCFYLFDDSADFSLDCRTQKTTPIKKSGFWRSTSQPKEPSRAGTAWCNQLISRLQSKTPLSATLLRGVMASAGPCKSPFYPKGLRNVVFTQQQFMNSKSAWRKIHKDYKKLSPGGPFNHFFWHYQGLYRQVFRIAEIAQQVRPADCYHTISTGYAGFLGAVISATSDRPLIVTEHGIYTRERRIDLNDASWLASQHVKRSVFHEPTDQLMRKLWIRFFEQLSLTTYQQATRITTLYESNRQFQIQEGAPADKTVVIRNGIDLNQFKQTKAPERHTPPRPTKTPATAKHRIALIGRVVSIKDVTTFIKSISLLTTKHPHVEVMIVGPLDEQPEYVSQCRVIIDLLNLDDKITLTGSQNISDLLPTLDLVVLTSISEAQPLVLLEAMACHVPVVATNVGACREIIEGFNPQNPKPCGVVVPVAAPENTAKAMSRLLSNAHLRDKLGKTGRQRVERFYSDKSMLAAYARTYLDTLPKPVAAAKRKAPSTRTVQTSRSKSAAAAYQRTQGAIAANQSERRKNTPATQKRAGSTHAKQAISSFKAQKRKLGPSARSQQTAIERQRKSFAKQVARDKVQSSNNA